MNLKYIIALAAIAVGFDSYADETYTFGSWTVAVGDRVDIDYSGSRRFNAVGAHAAYKLASGVSDTIRTKGLRPVCAVSECSDEFGKGRRLAFTYQENGVKLVQTLSFYDSLPYFIARTSVGSTDGSDISSNYIAAFEIGDYMTLDGTDNHILWVPFDNDGHVAYENNKISASSVTGNKPSHEVGCVFDADSRNALIAGSVDHDIWKSGVTITGTYLNRITTFECLSGLSNSYTRDAIPHGAISGREVSSARFMVGAFDDWRNGMETFAVANTKVVEPFEWQGGNPVGWSSYGSQQEFVNYEGVVESARFMKDNLFDHGFYGRDGRITISLDAFGEDNISPVNLTKLSNRVFGEGTTYTYEGTKYDGMNMTLGLYGGPLTIWEWSLDSKIPGTGLNGTPDYYFRDVALKVNGNIYKVPSNGAIASDPTHPAFEQHIKHVFKQYASRGARYLKIDFMNCGIIQGDSYYRPEITTAVQAYNYAMKLVREQAEAYDMYIVLAMSPAFPYQYAHGRRTCCDRFSQLNESEYVMNATSYGWWYDRLYAVNDPDQMVLCKNSFKMGETEGENRVRATTGMVTGAFIFGDNFSDKVKDKDGVVRGYPEETRKRAMSIMGNDDINSYVRENTGSFRPVEGVAKYFWPNKCESAFVRTTDKYYYIAIFNFGYVNALSGDVDYDRFGIDGSDAGAVKELWFGTPIENDADGFHYEVPAGDVRVYRIDRLSAGIDENQVDIMNDSAVDVLISKEECACNIKSASPIRSIELYSPEGRCAGVKQSAAPTNEISMPLSFIPEIAIVKVVFASGKIAGYKVIP